MCSNILFSFIYKHQTIMKIIKLVIAFSFITICAYSQVAIKGINENSLPLMPPIDTLDNGILCVHYKLSVINDIRIKNDYQNYDLILQIGKQLSKFSDYREFINDSIALAEEKQGVNRNVIVQGMMSRGHGLYSESIYKNMPTGKYTVTDKILINPYSYEESIPQIKWNIIANTDSTILGYKCIQASCNFRGRDYIAWFTDEIAIDNGPWKFHGLPGLILKIEDQKKEYIYECTALYHPNWLSPIYRKRNRKEIETVRSKFLVAKKRAMNNPLSELKNDPRIISMKTPEMVGIKKIAYNPIEQD